jgi:hypothetical protein
MLVSAALTVAVIGWAATPLQSGFGARLVLAIAVCGGAGNLLQLGLAAVRGGGADDQSGGQLAARLTAAAMLPWAEVLTIAVLVLEALHPARPWHTALLGVAVLGYLFAVHLTETGQRPDSLRPQLPVLAAGLALLSLATGAAALPAASSGIASGLIRSLAIVAAVLAAGLALPTWTRRAGQDQAQPSRDGRSRDQRSR